MNPVPPHPAAPPLLGTEFCSLEGSLPVSITPQGLVARDEVRAKLASGRYALEDVPCPCGGRDDRLVATVDRYRVPHSTVLCGRCGLVRTNPRLTADSYVDFYTHHYRDLYERADHDPAAYYSAQVDRGRERADFVLRRCRPESPRPAVLEVGCGGGWNLLPFHERGWTAVGWDFDDDYLAAGRARGLDLRRGSLAEAVAEGHRFELVILSHVLEHLLDPRSDLEQLRRILLPHGAIYIEVPSLFDVGSNLLRYFQSAHTYSFVPGTLRPLVEAAGFRCLAMNSRIQSLWQPDTPQSEPTRPDPTLAARTVRFLRAREHDSRAARRWRGLCRRLERAWERRPGQRTHRLC